MKNFKADNENYVNEKGTSFLRLSLKKPKDWKWSLTTSSSSPEVAVPDIQLVDEDGCLLVDTSKQKPDYFLDRYRNGKAASFSAKYTQTPEPKIYPTRKSRSETPQLQNVVRKVEEDTQDKGTVKKRYWNWFNKNSSELVSDKNYCHYKDVESKKKEISLIKSSPVPKLPVEFARRVLLTKDITGKHITSPKPEIRSIYKSTSSYDCSRKPREPYPKQVSFSFNQKSNFNEETCSYYEQRRYNKKSPSDTNSKLKISAKEDNRKDFHKQKQKIFETNCNNQDQDKEIKKNSFCSRYFRKKNDVISSNFGTNVSSSEENLSMNIYENLNFQSCSDFSTCIYNCNPIKKSESYRNFKSPTDKLRKNYFSTHQSRSRSSSDTHIIGSKEQSSSGRSRDNSRRRRRVRSRQHSESLCSSSSSDHETIRTPRGRRRKNKSQIMKYAKGTLC
ncbi:uncharacterized protein LOC142324584 isoform X2 [Lycorma delicatula]|uniref:uncharacterized protein LOC142324584 isoform X2 n=1 Tax=Lycorma delicatula TaxID=130591 RepID=UPI003F519AD8